MLSLGQTREQTKRLRPFVEEEEEEEEEEKKEEGRGGIQLFVSRSCDVERIEILPEGRSYLLSLSQTR